VKKILSIAASDSGGGAGIQADIKAITLLNGFAMTAVTAITAQNTMEVSTVHPIPVELIKSQISTVLGDIGADAIKTGMLLNSDIAGSVAETLSAVKNIPVIVDPVIKSTSGHTLLSPEAIDILKAGIIPQSLIVTPNLEEASLLCGFTVNSLETMHRAAIEIFKMGTKNVLVKGGHLSGSCVDLLYDGSDFTELSSERINTKNTHGTGCALAAAVATGIAQEMTVLDAVIRAKEYVKTAIRFSLDFGSGHGPINHYANINRDAQIFRCTTLLNNALEKLCKTGISSLIPEVQSNFGYATTRAETPEDVVAFPGRIIKLKNTIATVCAPEPGASQHIAKIILTAMRHNPGYRSAMNIAYSPAIINACKKTGFSVFEFDRKKEPADIKKLEGSSLEWGSNQAISQAGKVPDIIFDRGDEGKEPMTRVLGIDPMNVADKIIKIYETVREINHRC